MGVISRPNSWVAVDSDPTTMLAYAPRVDPAPLTVSVPGRDPTMGSLIVVITNDTPEDVAVASVVFTVVVGKPSQEGSPLMPTTKSVKTLVSDTTTWSFNGPANPVTSGTADFTLAPASGGSAMLRAGKSVYVQVYDFQTVEVPSTSHVIVAETIAKVDPQYTGFSISTFPDGFYFDSLIPTVQRGSALVPAAQVANGTPVTLTWNSSVVDVKNQTVFWSSATTGQRQDTPTTLGEWTVPATAPLTSDTVFAVVVTAQDVGGEPLTAALLTSVAVQSPDLVARSVTADTATVKGTQSIGGALDAKGITATGVTVNGNLTASSANVNGAVTANGVTVNGTLVAGAATLNGALTAPSATVNGTLQASSLRTGNTAVTGLLTVRGGGVSAIAGMQGIGTGTHQANTDGFAIGVVGWPSSTSPGCVGYAAGQSGGMTVYATGGNLGAFGPLWSDYQASNGNSFVLPVASGAQYVLNGWQCGGGLQQASAPIWFYWVPLGTAASGVPSTVRIGDPSDDLKPPEPPGPKAADGAHEVVDRLLPFLAREPDAKEREELVDALRRL
ncbi:MAG: polymer-forming cytoskeletal protein [Actinomycetota bacterium]|nr:polymer-forming cytoskeletal protein [Actinomycetota bacterium]